MVGIRALLSVMLDLDQKKGPAPSNKRGSLYNKLPPKQNWVFEIDCSITVFIFLSLFVVVVVIVVVVVVVVVAVVVVALLILL